MEENKKTDEEILEPQNAEAESTEAESAEEATADKRGIRSAGSRGNSGLAVDTGTIQVHADDSRILLALRFSLDFSHNVRNTMLQTVGISLGIASELVGRVERNRKHLAGRERVANRILHILVGGKNALHFALARVVNLHTLALAVGHDGHIRRKHRMFLLQLAGKNTGVLSPVLLGNTQIRFSSHASYIPRKAAKNLFPQTEKLFPETKHPRSRSPRDAVCYG